MRNVPHIGSGIWALGSRWVVLFGLLGGGALLEVLRLCHWGWAVKVYSPTPLPIHSLCFLWLKRLKLWSQLPPLATWCYAFFAVVNCPSRTVSQNKLFLKSLLSWCLLTTAAQPNKCRMGTWQKFYRCWWSACSTLHCPSPVSSRPSTQRVSREKERKLLGFVFADSPNSCLNEWFSSGFPGPVVSASPGDIPRDANVTVPSTSLDQQLWGGGTVGCVWTGSSSGLLRITVLRHGISRNLQPRVFWALL